MKKFFQGLSLSSIVAGTLAAITSFLLAAKIGVAGSVIGAATSYIVSVVATNIYQNVIRASTEKLQSVGTDGDPGDGDPDGDSPADGSTDDTATAAESSASGSSPDGPVTENATDRSAAGSGSNATQLAASGESRSTVSAADLPGTGRTAVRRPREIISNRAAGRTYSVAELRRARKPRNVKRTAVIVTLVSGLLTVAVSAGVVMLLTRGQGTDTVVRDWSTPSVTTPSQTDSDTQQTTPLPKNDATQHDGTNDSKDSTSNGSTSGTDNTTGESGNESTESGTNSDTNGSTGTDSSESNGNTTGSNGSTGTDSGSNGGSTESGTDSGSNGSTGSSGSDNSSSSSNGTGSNSSSSSNTGTANGTSVKSVG
ncbi:hypothetical protein BMYO_1736 [Bifidobacterium myosotis]|uniref:Uncharacterized protein n=1 Tax=Bifidobacterium myosotis TaxID=1630166 RepID=A0A261FGX1_9BIFI|nr:hypothetical protein [Bifidobacterium myosotis]OZG58213.1 hypothetical protein BMYO_1736 [Bifidobacterium myosotis]